MVAVGLPYPHEEWQDVLDFKHSEAYSDAPDGTGLTKGLPAEKQHLPNIQLDPDDP